MVGENENPIEYMQRIANWFDYMTLDFSIGMRSVEDCVKLFEAWIADTDLPEFPDSTEDDFGNYLPATVHKILGYHPSGALQPARKSFPS